MRNNTVRKMAVNAMVAALYFALSLPFMTLIFGPVQLRISEAFTLLPVFSATPIAGLTLGCVLVNAFGAFTNANILGPLDIVFGSAATLLAAFLTYHLRNVRFKNLPLLSALMPVLTNGIIIGLELTFVMSGGFQPAGLSDQRRTGRAGRGGCLLCAGPADGARAGKNRRGQKNLLRFAL